MSIHRRNYMKNLLSIMINSTRSITCSRNRNGNEKIRMEIERMADSQGVRLVLYKYLHLRGGKYSNNLKTNEQ